MAMTQEQKREYQRKWRAENAARISARTKAYRLANRERLRAQKREYMTRYNVDHADKVRASREKYNRSEKGRATKAHYEKTYQRTEESHARQAQRIREWFRTEKGRASRAAAAKKHEATRLAIVWAILGNECAWHGLGGCEGPLHRDHIIPVQRRRKSGYTSISTSLTTWIIAHPKLAKQKLQPLCQRHNIFKCDMLNDEARAKWISKYPLVSSAA